MASTVLASDRDAARRTAQQQDLSPDIAVVPGTSRDHTAVQQFLSSVFPASAGADFAAQLDEPDYEPGSRLLIKRAAQVAGHLRLAPREIRFGNATLPVTCVVDVGVLPERRGAGYVSRLLEAAERTMTQRKDLVGLLRTSEPGFFRRLGWTVCARHGHWMVGCHRLLAQLQPSPDAPTPPRVGSRSRKSSRKSSELHIRYLRRVELAALARLYAAQTRGAYGATIRSEAYWRWLIDRRGYDRIYVAIEGSPEIKLDGQFAAILGYAAVRSARLVELVSDVARPDAAERLVARFCRDALEQDLREIRIDLPLDHPLCAVLRESGGRACHHELDRGQALMAKVFHPDRLVQTLHDEFLARIGSTGPWGQRELGFVMGNRGWILNITPRHCRWTAGMARRTRLACDEPQLGQLLLGHLDVPAAVQAGQVSALNRRTVELADELFPRRPLWLPPLDDLPATRYPV